MSKKDYTRFSNNPNKHAHNQVTEPVMEVKDIGTIDEVNDVEQETKVAEPVKEIKGVVANCVRLNVRKDPEPKSEILCTIEANQEVMIDETKSTEDFYRVCTAAGIEGYCVKYFIAVM